MQSYFRGIIMLCLLFLADFLLHFFFVICVAVVIVVLNNSCSKTGYAGLTKLESTAGKKRGTTQ